MSNTLPPGWVPPNLESDPNADPEMDHALNLNPEGNVVGYQTVDYFRKIAEGDHSSRRIREGVSLYEDRTSASLLPGSIEFGTGIVDNPSPPRKAILTNTGVDPLTILGIDPVGDYEVNTNCGPSLAPGASCEIQIVFVPKRNGEHSGGVIVDLGEAGKEVIQITGVGTGQVIVPPEPETPENTPTINVADATLRVGASTGITLPVFSLGMLSSAGAASKKFRILGSTLGPVAMTALPQSGSGFTITYAVAEMAAYSVIESYTIAANDDLWVQIAYTGDPDVPASRDLVFTAAGRATTVKVSASAYSDVPVDPEPEPEDPVAITRRIRIAGNQFYRATNNNTDQGGTLPTEGGIMLKSVNLFGAEGENFFFHGLWLNRPWRAMLDQIKDWGFNCIRYPFSGTLARTNPVLPAGAIHTTGNPDVIGKTALQFLDMVVDYCQEIGLYVVLDHHRRAAGAGADGGPTDGSYTKANWIQSWTIMANRYKDKINVVGADVHNEPHNLIWSAWADLVEECAEAILAVAPNWVIFVEGVGHHSTDNSKHYWWGGFLSEVADRPIELSIPHRVAYSPHEYGQSVGSQTWQARDGSPVANYPNNLPAVWDEFWGFIYWNNIAPIWIGEMGGHFGLNADTGVIDKPHQVPETQWMQALVRYLNGDRNVDGTMQTSEVAALAGSKKGMSWAWWGYPPISIDTGGLVRADYTTPQAPKLALIKPLLDVLP